MKKKGMSKSLAPELLVTPLPMGTTSSPSPMESPESAIFNKSSIKIIASSSKNYGNKKRPTMAYSTSALFASSPPKSVINNNANQKTIATISDLKDLTASCFDDLKRNLVDRSHSQILKDLEASHSRLYKRFKIQTQMLQQMMDEADKEYKKMSERINESQEAMKASYAEFTADVQATASRVCKTSIPELSKSFKEAVDVLQSRYGIPSKF